MALTSAPDSPGALALVDALAARVVAHEATTRRNQRRATGMAKLRGALGAVAGGALRQWGRDTPRPVRLSRKASEVVSPLAGSRQILAVLDALAALGFLTGANGVRWGLSFGGPDVFRGLAARYWPAPALLALAAECGVTSATIGKDFATVIPSKAPRVPEPVTLRALRRPGRNRVQEGWRLEVCPDDPTAARIARHVREANAFAAGFAVGGCAPPRWKRTYTGTWALGGRWAAAGDGNYQGMKEAQRLAAITIDGETVAELDVKASHLTIMHGLLGLPLPDEDPYDFPGVPRAVVKQWVAATLGKGTPVNRWTAEHLDEVPEATGHAAKEVGRAVLARYPFLSRPAAAVGKAAGITRMAHIAPPARLLTHRLMAIEADILTAAMDALRGRGVLALPMHDALIVPGSAAGAAEAALCAAFVERVGIEPRLDVAGGASRE